MPLERQVGVVGATMMGLGSIIGTGVFVSIGLVADLSGSAVLLAIAMAAVVAACNALSSAQLAANHPVSGGTYEYGYRYLHPTLGFAAGWMFLCAKSASAAAAALGFAGYLLNTADQDARWLVPCALVAVVAVTLVVLAGIRRSNRANVVIVSVTLASLVAFVALGSSQVTTENLAFELEPASLLQATALMFVAFTGYGRIATLGEEVLEPRRTIPRAIIATLVISTLVYIAVAVVAVGAAGADTLHAATTEKAAPLEVVARGFPFNVHRLVAIGAMTAMLGVLLNLVLGLSRVLLAMGRRGDMPRGTANLNVAIIAVGILIALLALSGSLRATWSFSTFTVLIYYAITNLAALQLTDEDRLYSKWWSRGGLLACLSLAFSIEPTMWLTGSGVLLVGLLWHWTRRRATARTDT